MSEGGGEGRGEEAEEGRVAESPSLFFFPLSLPLVFCSFSHVSKGGREGGEVGRGGSSGKEKEGGRGREGRRCKKNQTWPHSRDWPHIGQRSNKTGKTKRTNGPIFTQPHPPPYWGLSRKPPQPPSYVSLSQGTDGKGWTATTHGSGRPVRQFPGRRVGKNLHQAMQLGVKSPRERLLNKP